MRRVRDDQADLPENAGISYTLAESEDEPEITQSMQDKKPAEIAAITTVVQTTPAPPRREPEPEKQPGLLARIASIFSGSGDDEAPEKKPARKSSRTQSDSRRRGSQRRGDGRDRQQGKKGPQRKQQSKKKASKKKTARKARAKKSSGQDDTRRTDKSQDKDQQAATRDGRQSAGKRRSRGGRRRRRGGDAGSGTGAEREAKSQSDKPVSDKPGRTRPQTINRRVRRAVVGAANR